MKNLTKNSNIVYRHLRELGIIDNLENYVKCSKSNKKKLDLTQDKLDLSYIQAHLLFMGSGKYEYDVMSIVRKSKIVPVISLDSRVYDFFPSAYKRILKEVVEQGNSDVDILGILSEECDELFSMIVDELSDEADLILSRSFFKIINFPTHYLTFIFTDDIFKFAIYYPIDSKKDQLVTRFEVRNDERDYFSSMYNKDNLKEIVHHICSMLDNQFTNGDI